MNLDRLTITLPWPDMSLMPNRKNGRHWGGVHDAKVRALSDGRNAALAALGRNAMPRGGRMPVRITFASPDRRRRDIDNLLACIKPHLDGIAGALGVDDSLFRPILIDDAHDADRRGFVLVEITAGDAHA